jgi:hypothetical protein
VGVAGAPGEFAEAISARLSWTSWNAPVARSGGGTDEQAVSARVRSVGTGLSRTFGPFPGTGAVRLERVEPFRAEYHVSSQVRVPRILEERSLVGNDVPDHFAARAAEPPVCSVLPTSAPPAKYVPVLDAGSMS